MAKSMEQTKLCNGLSQPVADVQNLVRDMDDTNWFLPQEVGFIWRLRLKKLRLAS